MATVRLKTEQLTTGYSGDFNTHGLSEVVVYWEPNGDRDSVFIKDLDVFITARREWKDMRAAFRDRDLIPDNFNTRFGEPSSEAERTRGYY